MQRPDDPFRKDPNLPLPFDPDSVHRCPEFPPLRRRRLLAMGALFARSLGLVARLAMTYEYWRCP